MINGHWDDALGDVERLRIGGVKKLRTFPKVVSNCGLSKNVNGTQHIWVLGMSRTGELQTRTSKRFPENVKTAGSLSAWSLRTRPSFFLTRGSG